MANIRATLVETSDDGSVDRSMTRIFATREEAEAHNEAWEARNAPVIELLAGFGTTYSFEFEETDEEVSKSD